MTYVMHDVDVLDALYKMEEKKRMDMNMKKEIDKKVNVVFAPFLEKLADVTSESLSKDCSPENLNRIIELWSSANLVRNEMALRLYANKHFNEVLTHNVDAGAKKIRELEEKLKKISDLV